MRTTLTLEEDVAAKLRAEARRSGRSFKEVVNEFLRLGLNARKELKPAKPFVVRARAMVPLPGINFDNIEELLDQIEGPLRK
jgi:plasmid stability protein